MLVIQSCPALQADSLASEPSRKPPACTQILPLKSWVTLPKLLSLSEPQFPHLLVIEPPSGVMRIKWVSDCRALPGEKSPHKLCLASLVIPCVSFSCSPQGQALVVSVALRQ